MAATLGAIHLEGMTGLYCLMAISACMSLMFPTIYGIALDGLGPDAKIASAGLILAIVGGAFMPRLQGGIMDMETFLGTTGVRGSFYLPFLCFIFIAAYAFFTVRQHAKH
jgi:FHS family L-fucose permease-like MFS transporter